MDDLLTISKQQTIHKNLWKQKKPKN